MKNRLKWLMEDSHITCRKLSEYVGIAYSSLSKMANGSLDFSTKHITSLTLFFRCTSDFLLNIDDKGIQISFEDLGSYMFAYTVSLNEYNNLLKTREKRTYILNNHIVRIFCGKLTDEEIVKYVKGNNYKDGDDIRKECIEKIGELNKEQLKNVNKFIDAFILNEK